MTQNKALIDKALADSIRTFIRSRRDKKEIAFYKDKPKQNKQGMITNGAVIARLTAIVKRLTDDPEVLAQVTGIEKSKKTKEQHDLEFQQQKYQQFLALLPENTIDEELSALKQELHQFTLDAEKEFTVTEWLNEWTPKAKDISFATHVAKLTHSSSKGSSVLDRTQKRDERYLTTNTLIDPDIDTASANAASLPVAELLKLSVDATSILDKLKAGDSSFLKHLTDCDALVDTWYKNLKQAYDAQEKRSYFLNKQIYFPIDEGNSEYHLLLPLLSSSLIHAIYAEQQTYFSDEAKEARGQRKKERYSPKKVTSYPNKGTIHVTASNHSNASSLNGKRGGRIALFSTMPPQWQSNLPSIKNKKTIFDATLRHQLREPIIQLQNYLALLIDKQLSMNDPIRHAAIMTKLQAISEAFFDYITIIKHNETEADWTIQSDLKIEQQLLFAPNRSDEAALNAKVDKKWLRELSDAYGRWLNTQLEGGMLHRKNKSKKLNLTLIDSAIWRDHFFEQLREYIATEETTL